MRIYIDWEREEWWGNEAAFFENLIEDRILPTYSDYLADRFEGAIDDLLVLTEDEKIELRKDYETHLKENFEEHIKYNTLGYTVLEVEAKEGLAVKEIH